MKEVTQRVTWMLGVTVQEERTVNEPSDLGDTQRSVLAGMSLPSPTRSPPMPCAAFVVLAWPRDMGSPHLGAPRPKPPSAVLLVTPRFRSKVKGVHSESTRGQLPQRHAGRAEVLTQMTARPL